MAERYRRGRLTSALASKVGSSEVSWFGQHLEGDQADCSSSVLGLPQCAWWDAARI